MIEVSPHYIDGIKEGRAAFERHGIEWAADELRNLNSTIKGFAASTPVGQMLRGERDFWLNQQRVAGRVAR
jgi:hypothetical protein